ncbi:uncharacterized protein LOC142163256 [Nicotiana tabacum]|uniref:Uncharacterized protein LOC142163256 n=1 Tax=Nicotiana tabacum TaxID=4097 RepID=A0AC58RV70_TOBAC
MLGYAKFMKDLVTKKRSMDYETIKMTHQVSAIVQSMAPNLEYPDAFTIPCTIGSVDFAKVDRFILPADFVILDCEVDYKVPIILGKPFLETGKALVVGEVGELTFQPNNTEVCSFVDLVMEVLVDDTSAMINVEDPL